MASNLYAKLVDGQPVTTCVPDDDPETLALIVADGFKPYDESALPPQTEAVSEVAAFDPGAIASKDIGLRSSTKLDTVASEKKSGTAQKLAEPSLSEAVPAYRDDGDRIVLEWEIVPNSPTKIADEIARLQSELAATDYQVIKSYEFALAGEKPPYDLTALHSDRQALRDRISELEVLL